MSRECACGASIRANAIRCTLCSVRRGLDARDDAQLRRACGHKPSSYYDGLLEWAMREIQAKKPAKA